MGLPNIQEVSPPSIETDVMDDEINAEVHVSSPGRDGNDRPLHYYVDVPDVDESTYDACDRSVGIDHGFHAQL